MFLHDFLLVHTSTPSAREGHHYSESLGQLTPGMSM